MPYYHLKSGTPGQEKGRNFLKVEAESCLFPFGNPCVFQFQSAPGNLHNLDTHFCLDQVHSCSTSMELRYSQKVNSLCLLCVIFSALMKYLSDHCNRISKLQRHCSGRKLRKKNKQYNLTDTQATTSTITIHHNWHQVQTSHIDLYHMKSNCHKQEALCFRLSTSTYCTSVHLSKQEGKRERGKLCTPDVGDNKCIPELSHSTET